MMDEQRYVELKSFLPVDQMRLTEELMELPQRQMDASEGAAEAALYRDQCKDLVDQAKADAAADIRNLDINERKPRSETQIASEIMLDEKVREALADLRNAEYDLATWKALSDSMRTKSSSIRAIADLIQAGYTTPNAVLTQRRGAINQQRQALKG